MKCSGIRLQYTEDTKIMEIVLTTLKCHQTQQEVAVLKEIIAKGKELDVSIKKFTQKRSLDANALLWKMCTEIANIIKSDKDAVYLTMLENYGVFTHVIVKQEAVDRMIQQWKTARVLGEVTINGKTGIQIQCYYGSHLYDSKEFSVLLDGVISDAKELGIEVINESEKNLLISEWGKK